jgi:hypothetical protein
MIPVPKKVVFLEGKNGFKILSNGRIFSKPETYKFARSIQTFIMESMGKNLSINSHARWNSTIEILINDDLITHPQGYRIIIKPSHISLIAKTPQGLFYAVQTLKQLLRKYGENLPAVFIEDKPDFETRGFMLDISRDRVPKLETLKQLVKLLAELKYNQLQLYIEHTFAYEKHEKVWKEYSPLTHQEVLELDKFCKEYFMELVPAQNTFGHMEKWLMHDEYKHLAECPNGFVLPWGEFSGPFSLSPAVPESLEFVESLLDELLPHFSSSKVNIGGDETFDLCLGRSKQLCEKNGKGRVYLNFLIGIYNILKKYGKTMMFWGDIIKNYPDLVEEIPEDAIALIWGYEENHPFEKECELFSSKGIPFYVCPGTSSWNSFVGRVDNALGNIKNAIYSGQKHGSLGFLLTDWGDNGHPQHPLISILPMVFAASIGWNCSAELSPDDLIKFTDLYIFKTNDISLSKILYILGNIYKDFKTTNASIYFHALIFPDKFDVKSLDEKDIEVIKSNLTEVERVISELKNCRDSSLRFLIDQLINNAEMLSLSMRYILLLKKYGNIHLIPKNEWFDFEKSFQEMIEKYKSVWLKLNKPGGLKQSFEKLTKILKIRSKNLER